MSSDKSEQIIRWAFVLASVTGIWQLELPKYLDDIARAIGAGHGSLLYNVIVDGGVPVLLILLAQVALLVHDKVLWALSSKNYQGGWWIYSLVSQTTEGPVSMAGYFYLLHSPKEAYAIDGHAFYLNKGVLSYRGDWESDTVVINDPDIRMLFNMRAVNPAPKALPSHYEGYLELKRAKRKTTAAKSSWYGYFQDLGDRAMVSGPIYAERLRRKLLRRQIGVEEVLQREANRLYQQVLARTSQCLHRSSEGGRCS
jgi:hypothetical protein